MNPNKRWASVKVPRFMRTDTSDGASEVLTLVRIKGRPGYYVEVCAGPDVGDDFVGLYDLYQNCINSFECEWERAETVPANVVRELTQNWEKGGTTIHPMV